jgi:rhodanese-related sulfurtransferase
MQHTFSRGWTAALARSFALALGLGLAGGAHAQIDKATTEALESYFEFSDYASGTIATEQIPASDWGKFHLLDVRDAGQYAKEHIPGALNIEWRKVFAERAKLPRDRTILVYCNTGSFSGQVAMALRMAGFENVRILHGGLGEWKAARARAGSK